MSENLQSFACNWGHLKMEWLIWILFRSSYPLAFIIFPLLSLAGLLLYFPLREMFRATKESKCQVARSFTLLVSSKMSDYKLLQFLQVTFPHITQTIASPCLS